MIELFDSHAHLQEPEFGADRQAVLEAARAAGVTGILVPAVDLATGEAALTLAERFPEVYAALGCHPHEAAFLTPANFERIECLLSAPKAVAVGEIGLDFYRMHSPAGAQVRVFETMLTLAERKQVPVVIHCRDAVATLRPILETWARHAAAAVSSPLGVLHYFSEDIETAERYVELDFLISVHTSVTHPKAERLRAVATAIPLEHLVIETDSPYGAPQANRGKRNEPAYVLEAARTIAGLKGISVAEVARATAANARRLFRLETNVSLSAGAHP